MQVRVLFLTIISLIITQSLRAEMRLDKSRSELGFHGVAALHSFDAKTGQFSGKASVKDSIETASGEIELDAKSIDTGIEGRNKEMFKLLEVEKHPKIFFSLKSAKPLPNQTDDGRVLEDLPAGETKCLLSGALKIKGISKNVEAKGKCKKNTAGGWFAEGEAPVDMQAFAITPPKISFIGMNPVVQVRFKLYFER